MATDEETVAVADTARRATSERGCLLESQGPVIASLGPGSRRGRVENPVRLLLAGGEAPESGNGAAAGRQSAASARAPRSAPGRSRSGSGASRSSLRAEPRIRCGPSARRRGTHRAGVPVIRPSSQSCCFLVGLIAKMRAAMWAVMVVHSSVSASLVPLTACSAKFGQRSPSARSSRSIAAMASLGSGP